MRAWRAFLEAHAAISKQMERELREECDLPLSWYDALVQLHEAGGSLRMHELADHLLLSRSATTRFADRLEGAGFIERRSAKSVEHFVGRFDEDELRQIEALFGRLGADRG